MADRIRGRKLMARNVRLEQTQPWCAECLKQGRHRLGTQSDHIVALMNGGEDTESNLQRLCDDCHKHKTNVDKGHKQRPLIGTDGWPAG